MAKVTGKILLQCIVVFLAFSAYAQDGWPSPEVEQMYHHAQEYTARGNYKDAITTYRQAIALAPDKFILHKDLGKTLYLSGSYSEAEQTLQPISEIQEADEECYYYLAASQAAQNKTKNATGTLKAGITLFPAAGILYFEEGKVLELEYKPDAALQAWVEGIHKDPGCPQNYYEAARIYTDTTKGVAKVMWGLLYGEIYLNITNDTVGEEAFKKMFFSAYKTMFDNIASDNIIEKAPANSFIDAVQQTYLTLTPVVSDGVTTENLTMVRTRFLMDWFAKYSGKYSYSLFAYQDYLVRNGLFDIYNEWLFGKVESIIEYNAWNQFHPGEIDLFLEKRRVHALHPLTTDVYTDQGMDGMIRRRKR